jgi:hypothetical protein
MLAISEVLRRFEVVLLDGRPWVFLAAIVAWLWIAGAACWSLRRSYISRTRMFVDSLPDGAVRLYLQRWAPTVNAHSRDALRAHLKQTVPWGWGRPLAFAALSASTIALLIGFALSTGAKAPRGGNVTLQLTEGAASALAGALTWVVFDQLARIRRGDYTQDDVASHSFRLIMAVPMGAALSVFGNAGFPFLLGAFPTTTLMTLGQRVVDRKLNLGDLTNGGLHLELERLQGVGRPDAERFAEQGVRSLLQLAYTDPFVLALRSSFEFDVVSDLVSQALLWTYGTDGGLPKLQAVGLRGAIEVRHLQERLENGEPAAQQIVADAAAALGIGRDALENMFTELARDHYAQFICALWDGAQRRDAPDYIRSAA